MVTGNQTARAINAVPERNELVNRAIASGINAVAGMGPISFRFARTPSFASWGIVFALSAAIAMSSALAPRPALLAVSTTVPTFSCNATPTFR